MKISFTRTLLAVAALATFAAVAPSRAEQPHMDQALTYLQKAREQLQQAEHNKEGWRVKALKDLDQVIADVQAGKQAAK